MLHKKKQLVKVGVSYVKIEDYYKAKLKMDTLEQVNQIKEPLVDLLNVLSSPDYRFEGNYQSGSFKDHADKCNVRLMNGTKTLIKIDNKDLAVRVLTSIVDSLNNISAEVEKEIKKL